MNQEYQPKLISNLTETEMRKFNPSALLLIFMMSYFSAGCSKLPSNSDIPTRRIIVGSGPEDMVLDTLDGEQRLLISCAGRRDGLPEFGEIVSYNLISGKIDTLARVNEPDSIVSRPHGIFMEGRTLYIISHEHEPDDHVVLIYQIRDDRLIFKDMIRSLYLNSPNALVTGKSGEIYVVNDSGKRGSLAEKMFRLKRASVVRFDRSEEGQWSGRTAAVNLGYPAGINRIGDRIFVGDAVLHVIHVYKISEDGLVPIKEIGNLRGNDNIRIQDGKLLVPGHIKPFKFVGHVKDAASVSPVKVFLVDPKSGSVESIFFDDGNRISAGSTAIIYKNQLFISQVFEPFILQVDMR